MVDRCKSISRYRKCFCDGLCGHPTFGGPFFNPGDFGSASSDESRGLYPFGGSFLDPGALQGTLVPSCELLTFVSPDSVRGACAWLDSVGEVELFQYGVGRTFYGIKGLTDREVRSGDILL